MLRNLIGLSALIVATACADTQEFESSAAPPPADPLTAAIQDVCLPALKNIARLRSLAVGAGFDWIDPSANGVRPMAIANGVSISEDASGVCKIAFSAEPPSFEEVWSRAKALAFADAPPLRETKGPQGNAAFSCRDVPRRSLLVTVTDGGALPETMELAGQSFTRLGGELRLADVRIFLIDDDCTGMDRRLKAASAEKN